MSNTTFKTIPGYPKYEIDMYGNIRRIYKKKKVLLKPIFKQCGYTIRLSTPEGHRKEERVHKLMQLVYLPPAPPDKVVYHKNGNKKDNWFNNLGYITRQDLGRKTGANSRRKPVAKINKNGEIVSTYSSARQAARENYMSYQTVNDRCNGKVKSKYAPDGYQYVWDGDHLYQNGVIP